MKIHFKIIVLFMLLQYIIMVPHGFASDTLVGLEDSQVALSIKEISTKFFSGQKTKVCSYKEKSHAWKVKPVQAVAYCQSNVFFELSFVQNNTSLPETMNCSPLQLFYRLPDQAWIPAHELLEGDVLLCKNGVTTQLQFKKQISDSISLYIIEVKKHHTFVVGHQKILTHNMFIPVAATIGMAIPFDLVLQAGAWGCMFGPVTFCCSIAVAGVVAAAVAYQCGKEKQTEFILKCEGIGHYEMQPIHYGTNGGAGVPDFGCTHKATVEDVLRGAKEQGNTCGPSKIYEKPGTVDDIWKDFYELQPKEIKKFKDSAGIDGEYGFLEDGCKVTVRITSSDERPTLEIGQKQNSTDKKIKIRYGDILDSNKT